MKLWLVINILVGIPSFLWVRYSKTEIDVTTSRLLREVYYKLSTFDYFVAIVLMLSLVSGFIQTAVVLFLWALS